MSAARLEKRFASPARTGARFGGLLAAAISRCLPADPDFQSGALVGLGVNAGWGPEMRYGLGLGVQRTARRTGPDFFMIHSAILRLAAGGIDLEALACSEIFSTSRLEEALERGGWRVFEAPARDACESLGALAEARSLAAGLPSMGARAGKAPAL